MSNISKVALYFPEKIYTTNDFFTDFPEERESKTWKKLGIDKRHIIGENEVPSDMGFNAAEKLISLHPELKNEIDFILFTSPERDYYTPITAGVLQHRLGLGNNVGCMDVHQGCSSFIYLVSHADGLIKVGAASKVLVIAVSSLSKKFHAQDKANRFIFGDGAAAFIVEKDTAANFHSYYFGNDGEKKDKIIILDGEHRSPLNEKSFEQFQNSHGEQQYPGHFYQDGAGVFRFTLDRVPKMINAVLEKNQLTKDDIDLYLLHQPNELIVKTLARIAKLPEDKVILDVKDYGNTVSVTIPILIHNLLKDNKITKGQKILIAAFGTGLSWNCCIWEI